MPKQSAQLSLTVASTWASTNPGTTKYHYYDGNGESLCSYDRKPGSLHAWVKPYTAATYPSDACSSCLLHFQKGHHLAAAAPGPTTELPAGTRVRVIKGELKGAFGRIQRYDGQSRLYFVEFSSRSNTQFKPLPPDHLEEALL